jgi:Ser/Thr protein kinase RdoA (MazF antagonist)
MTSPNFGIVARQTLTMADLEMEIFAIAREALFRYDIEPVQVLIAAESFNTIVRIDATDGREYALRIAPDLDLHATVEAAIEYSWLARLARERVVIGPEMLRNRDGALVTHVASPTGGPTRRVSLLTWIEGSDPVVPVADSMVEAFGAVLARLHDDAATWRVVDVAGLRYDRVLYWPVPRLLETAGEHRDVFIAAEQRAQPTIDALWTEPAHVPHLLHGDFGPDNVVIARDGSVRPIDFQDLIVGFAVQDIAITLSNLAHPDDLPPTPTIDALQRGYESVRPWPEFDRATLLALRMARRVLQANLTLHVKRPGWEDRLSAHAHHLEAWLDSP